MTEPAEGRSVMLRLAAPLQAWGSAASSAYRPTERIPTRSGIEGLIRAALGLHRDEGSPAWLRDAHIRVRVDRSGSVVEDFHTVVAPPTDVVELHRRASVLRDARPLHRADYQVRNHGGKPWLIGGGAPSYVSRRTYLSDAEFIVAIDTTEPELLHSALARPVFAPFLGRKACIPAFPFLLGFSVSGHPLAELATASPAGSLRVLELTSAAPQLLGRVDPPRPDDVLAAWHSSCRA